MKTAMHNMKNAGGKGTEGVEDGPDIADVEEETGFA